MPRLETETKENKKSLAELSEGLVSLAAILNKHGAGELWFGVKNNGSPAGMDVAETTLRKVSQAIAAKIEPKIYPQVTREEIEGKACVRVLFSGTEAPYYAHGRAYLRVADEDRLMSAAELESFILKKNETLRYWDAETLPSADFRLDTKKLKAFVQQAGLEWKDADAALRNLGLKVGDDYRNAAALFFSKEPRVRLRCAVFAGTTAATILDRHDSDGDILSLIQEAEKYILQNIHLGMRVEGLRRIDVPEIDREALREAIVNAFCHRDYRDLDEVRVAVFRDRVEIRNPGELVDGMTIESLVRGNLSRRRNPLVADLLRRIELIEAWGRGIPLILDKAPKVTFRQGAGVFVSQFPRAASPEVTGQVAGQDIGQVTGQVADLLEVITGDQSRKELMTALQLVGRDHFQKSYLQPAVEQGLVEMTMPEKPNSRLQRYRLTPLGLQTRARLAATLPSPELTPEVTGQVAGQVTGQVADLLKALTEDQSRKELMSGLKLRGRDHFEKAYLQPAIQQGLVEMTIPEKPTSRLQKYRLTQRGTDLRARLLNEASSPQDTPEVNKGR